MGGRKAAVPVFNFLIAKYFTFLAKVLLQDRGLQTKSCLRKILPATSKRL
jgi:hypothetical protein